MIDIDINQQINAVQTNPVVEEPNPIAINNNQLALVQPEDQVLEDNSPVEIDYTINTYEDYYGYSVAILEYEEKDFRTNLYSTFIGIPLLLVYRLLYLSFQLIKKVLEVALKTIAFTLVFIDILIKRFYETSINIYGIVSIILCMLYSSENYVATVLLSLCLFDRIKSLFAGSKFILIKILGTTITNTQWSETKIQEKLLAAIVYKCVLSIVYIVNLGLTFNSYGIVYKALLLSGLALEAIYYATFPYYLKHKCSNIVVLQRYGLVEKIEAILDNRVKTDIDEKLKLVPKNHICDKSYNGTCSKCPCAICYDNLDIGETTELSCGHIYHITCIRQSAIYEYQKYKKAECPACRTKLI